jgi:hypothetical protein
MDYREIITIEPGKRRGRGFPKGGKGAASFQAPTSPSRAAVKALSLSKGAKSSRWAQGTPPRWPKVCAPPAQLVVGDRNVAAPWPPADSSRTNDLARVFGSSG